jgi:hypothetical protein
MEKVSLLSEEFEAREFNRWISGWKNVSGTGKRLYLDENVSLELFVHIGKFIFPDFIEIKGLVFIKELVNPELITCASDYPGAEEYQASFNRLDIAMYFNQSVSTSNNDIYNAALEVIKTGWELSLKKLFPHLVFVVETSNEEAYGPYVWFYQKQT